MSRTYKKPSTQKRTDRIRRLRRRRRKDKTAWREERGNWLTRVVSPA